MSTENLTETTTPETTTPELPELSEFDNRGVLYKIRDDIARQNSEEAKTLAEEAKTLAESLSSEDSEEDATTEKTAELDYLAHYHWRVQQIMSKANKDDKTFASLNINEGANADELWGGTQEEAYINYYHIFMHPKYKGSLALSGGKRNVLVSKGVTSILGNPSDDIHLDMTLFTGDSIFPELTMDAEYAIEYITKIIVQQGRKEELIAMTNWSAVADKIEEVQTW